MKKNISNDNKNKSILSVLKKVFFIISGGLLLIGCVTTVVEYIKIQRDRFTSFPAWVVFVFYLVPCLMLALIFLGAALLCGHINKKNNKNSTAKKNEEVKNLGMTYGEKIYTLREKSGMSQEELAEKLDVSRQTISNWENDKVKIDIIKAKQLCDIFCISIEEFCKDDNMSFVISEEKQEEKSVLNEKTNKNAKQRKRDVLIMGLILCISLFFIVLSVVQMIQTKTITIGSMIQLKGSWLTLGIVGLVVVAILFHRNKKK